jgi:hypothetical protein
MTDLRRLTGTEEEVFFHNGDEFTGVECTWLLPRLRLDPNASPVDATGGFVIYLEDDSIDIPDWATVPDLHDLLGTGPHDGLLVAYGNGGIFGGRCEVVGGWIEDWSPEVRRDLIWVGNVTDLHGLAMTYLWQGLSDWEPNHDELLEVDSPYLSVERLEDVEGVLGLAAEAGQVILNGTSIR